MFTTQAWSHDVQPVLQPPSNDCTPTYILYAMYVRGICVIKISYVARLSCAISATRIRDSCAHCAADSGAISPRQNLDSQTTYFFPHMDSCAPGTAIAKSEVSCYKLDPRQLKAGTYSFMPGLGYTSSSRPSTNNHLKRFRQASR
ncbi:hypothetical protein OPQ81_008101 [Rhizoctonia solani]|nr:hypothetical protein OPQ81_008101 [Rhizoctonia solani]